MTAPLDIRAVDVDVGVGVEMEGIIVEEGEGMAGLEGRRSNVRVSLPFECSSKSNR